MNHPPVLSEDEAQFRAELRPFLLRFKNPELDEKFRFYIAYEKKSPQWFVGIMWSFIFVLILRRALLVVYSYIAIGSMELRIDIEITNLIVLVGALLIEAFIFLSGCLIFLKGFSILVALFFVISYSSHVYYPGEPAMIIT
ncbi:MAG: hypothetical protein P4M11_12700 [Candidatus Pacebacteria bacterium]|nr:hypothetical protein [Candidatus Paceibacterota bacterium]